MKKIFISGLILLASSGIAFAQAPGFLTPQDQAAFNANVNSNNTSSGGQVRDLKSLISFIMDYIDQAILLLMALATVAFVYNVVMYFVVKTDGERTEASKYLIYSIIGIAVIVSFWGIVNVVIKTFGFENTRPPINQLYFNNK